MTTVKVKVVADSESPHGKRITTVQCRYPRVVHPELMTHRAFSRNASSSRAIPVERKIQEVMDDPYVPIYWGKNQKGMVAEGELGPEEKAQAEAIWLHSRDQTVSYVKELVKLGLHKEEANRLLEPFSHIDVIFTSTEWGNFYNLRRDKNAHRLMQALAGAAYEAQRQSTPVRVNMGHWHLPYITKEEREEYDERILRMASVARCARVSYAKHDGSVPSIKEDCALHDQLKERLHMSAFEHQATPMIYVCKNSGNLWGWEQYRKEIPNENRPIYNGPT